MQPQGFEAGWHIAVSHPATELPAQLQPHAVNRARRKLRRIGIRHRPDPVGTRQRVGARKSDAQRILKIGLQAGAVIAAISARQIDAGLYLHTSQWRLDMHTRHFVGRIWQKMQQKRFVAQQQRVRCHVVGP